MDIACNLDDNYVKPCVVMLTSLFVNNPGEDFHIHIITDGLSGESRQLLSDTVEGEYKQKLSFYRIDKERMPFLPVVRDSYISIATYYRCFMASILPPDIHKVLYLDCDLLVLKSLKDLWDTDLDGFAVGAVEESCSGMQAFYTRLRYPKEDAYFNAGVLLVNLDFWRKHGIEKEIAAYIARWPERLECND